MKQLRIGIIGVTGRGGDLYVHWHQPQGRAVVVGGMDINQKDLDTFKQKVSGNPFITLDHQELLARKDIDAIAVTSPDFTHEKYAIAALEAGKHVFCEKPMAITTEGCDKILRAWKKSGKRFMIGFNMRHMKIFQTMKKIVDDGIIGEIKSVWVRHFVSGGSSWYYHDWHANRKNTTGLLLQKASHDIDMIHWITGSYTKRVAAFGGLDFFGGDKPNDLICSKCDQKDTCVEAQFGKTQQCAFRQEVDVEDNTVMIMELEKGIKASYQQCHFTPDYFRNYTFNGTKGRMENLNDADKVMVLTRKSTKHDDFDKKIYDIEVTPGGHVGADRVICNDFVDMVLTGKDPVSTPEAGRMSVATGCAATESTRNNGCVVAVSPMPNL